MPPPSVMKAIPIISGMANILRVLRTGRQLLDHTVSWWNRDDMKIIIIEHVENVNLLIDKIVIESQTKFNIYDLYFQPITIL